MQSLHLFGGDEGIRTPDPLLAKQMLYQLSYIPILQTKAHKKKWWAHLGSNQRPLRYQHSALAN